MVSGNGLEMPALPSPVSMRFRCAHDCEDLVYSGQQSQPFKSYRFRRRIDSCSDSEDPPIPIAVDVIEVLNER